MTSILQCIYRLTTVTNGIRFYINGILNKHSVMTCPSIRPQSYPIYSISSSSLPTSFLSIFLDAPLTFAFMIYLLYLILPRFSLVYIQQRVVQSLYQVFGFMDIHSDRRIARSSHIVDDSVREEVLMCHSRKSINMGTASCICRSASST